MLSVKLYLSDLGEVGYEAWWARVLAVPLDIFSCSEAAAAAAA